jgi:hypothetical protein
MNTPETDQMVATDLHHLEDDETCPASVYWRIVELARTLERERDRMQALAEANGKLAHSSACEAMEYRRERDEARASLAAAEAWSATLADIGDDFRAANAELRAAIRNLRDVQGRHHTQIATERLFAVLPEASSQPERG